MMVDYVAIVVQEGREVFIGSRIRGEGVLSRGDRFGVLVVVVGPEMSYRGVRQKRSGGGQGGDARGETQMRGWEEGRGVITR